MARSAYGKRFSLREAAEYLDMTRDQLRAVARRRRITFHQDGDGFEQTRPKQDGTIGRYRRGGNYFFYERDLLAYLDRTSVPALPGAVVTAGHDSGRGASNGFADISDLLPTKRRFQ